VFIVYGYSITGALFAPRLHDVIAIGRVAPAGRVKEVAKVASVGYPFAPIPLIYFNPVITDPDIAPDDPVPRDIIPANDPVVDVPAVKNTPLMFTGIFAIVLFFK
jgi:hypothetical protein